MSLQLPSAKPAYDSTDEASARRSLMDEDRRNLKRGEDIEVGPRASRLILTDEDTGQRYRLKMASGVATWEPM